MSIELSIMKVVSLMLVPMSVQSTQCEYYGHRHITGSGGRGATEFPLELLLTNQSSSRRTNRRRKNFQLLKYFQTLNNGAGNSWNNSFVGGWGWNLGGWRLHHAWDQQSENNSSIRYRTNKRPAFRSRDQPRPIRGQYSHLMERFKSRSHCAIKSIIF